MAPVSLDPPLMCIVYVYAGELLYYLDPKVIKTLTERLNEKLPEILNHDCNEIKTRRDSYLHSPWYFLYAVHDPGRGKLNHSYIVHMQQSALRDTSR